MKLKLDNIRFPRFQIRKRRRTTHFNDQRRKIYKLSEIRAITHDDSDEETKNNRPIYGGKIKGI